MSLQEYISLIENSSPNSTIIITLSEENLTDESLKRLLGFSESNSTNSSVKITEGYYITANSVTVFVSINIEADIEITVKPSLNENRTVNLLNNIWQWKIIGDEEGQIDWGDGTVETISDIAESTMTHVYNSNDDSEYIIKIYGIRWTGSNGSSGCNNTEAITQITFNKEQIITNPNYIFMGLVNLKKN